MGGSGREAEAGVAGIELCLWPSTKGWLDLTTTTPACLPLDLPCTCLTACSRLPAHPPACRLCAVRMATLTTQCSTSVLSGEGGCACCAALSCAELCLMRAPSGERAARRAVPLASSHHPSLLPTRHPPLQDFRGGDARQPAAAGAAPGAAQRASRVGADALTSERQSLLRHAGRAQSRPRLRCQSGIRCSGEDVAMVFLPHKD